MTFERLLRFGCHQLGTFLNDCANFERAICLIEPYVDFELLFDKDREPNQKYLSSLLAQPDVFLRLAKTYGKSFFQESSLQDRVKLICGAQDVRNLGELIQEILGTSDIMAESTHLLSSVYQHWLERLICHLSRKFIYRKCLNTKQFKPLYHSLKHDILLDSNRIHEDLPQQITGLIRAGTFQHFLDTGVTQQTQRTPFLCLIDSVYSDLQRILSWYYLLARQRSNRTVKYFMEHHEDIALELSREWLEILQGAGVDLQDYGKHEKQFFRHFDQKRHLFLNRPRQTLPMWRLVNFAYGPEISDWKLYIVEEMSESFLQFWDMVEHPERSMPGAWKDCDEVLSYLEYLSDRFDEYEPEYRDDETDSHSGLDGYPYNDTSDEDGENMDEDGSFVIESTNDEITATRNDHDDDDDS
jgi:hypothetical protein